MGLPPVLILSNGHGEDAIAARIAEVWQGLNPAGELAVLPLVGEGHAFQKLALPILGKVQTLPSGGFIYMDSRQLWRDLRGGLIGLTLAQYQAVQEWRQKGGKILAVGDIVPLLFAWLSGCDYGFVGTAKSEYYRRDEQGWLPSTNWLAKQMGSDYYPWERWLMRSPRCQAVFPRDTLTTQTLQNFGIPAVDAGNPMMDGLTPDLSPPALPGDRLPQRVLLLPGSRPPEAWANWQLILQAVQALIAQWPNRAWVFLAAIAPSLSLEPFQTALASYPWQSALSPHPPVSPSLSFTQGPAALHLSQTDYPDFLHQAHLAIAMAGTATEQFVGLGKPVFSLPGKGPQFTLTFAQRQTYLLGPSVILLETPQTLPDAVLKLFQNSPHLAAIAQNGRQRLGQPGAAQKIALHLQTLWHDSINKY
ncbi:MAG: lipid-A-disaccharide synthase-related protein [Microcystaceae cyanobacterium]